MTTILEHQVNFINEEIIKLKLENQQLKDKNIELESRLKKYTSNQGHKKYYEEHKLEVKNQASVYLQNLKEINPDKLKIYRQRAYQNRKQKLAIIKEQENNNK